MLNGFLVVVALVSPLLIVIEVLKVLGSPIEYPMGYALSGIGSWIVQALAETWGTVRRLAFGVAILDRAAQKILGCLGKSLYGAHYPFLIGTFVGQGGP